MRVKLPTSGWDGVVCSDGTIVVTTPNGAWQEPLCDPEQAVLDQFPAECEDE